MKVNSASIRLITLMIDIKIPFLWYNLKGKCIRTFLMQLFFMIYTGMFICSFLFCSTFYASAHKFSRLSTSTG